MFLHLCFPRLIIAYLVNSSLYGGNDILPTEWKQFDQTDDYHKALLEPNSYTEIMWHVQIFRWNCYVTCPNIPIVLHPTRSIADNILRDLFGGNYGKEPSGRVLYDKSNICSVGTWDIGFFGEVETKNTSQEEP